MKKVFGFTVVVLVFTASMAFGAISIQNLGFEDGLNGWNTNVPVGGSINVVSSHTDTSSSPYGSASGVTSWSAYSGDDFALLKTDGPGTDITLYQSFTADAGDVLEFMYFWDSQDYKPFADAASGAIYLGDDTSGTQVATLFSENILSDPLNHWGTSWKKVSWIAPYASTFTLAFNIENGLDGILDSYLGIDAVPVPGAFILSALGTGLIGLIRCRQMIS